MSKTMEGVVLFEAKQGEALHRSSKKSPKAREGVHIRAWNGRLLEARSAEHCLDRVGHTGRNPPFPPPTPLAYRLLRHWGAPLTQARAASQGQTPPPGVCGGPCRKDKLCPTRDSATPQPFATNFLGGRWAEPCPHRPRCAPSMAPMVVRPFGRHQVCIGLSKNMLTPQGPPLALRRHLAGSTPIAWNWARAADNC